MQRTQIYLDPELSAALGRVARKRGQTKAEVIRVAARRFLEQEQIGEEDPVLGIIGLGSADPGNASENHDVVLAEMELHSYR